MPFFPFPSRRVWSQKWSQLHRNNPAFVTESPYVVMPLDRSGPGNLNKPFGGESATVDALAGRKNGADDGKPNETDALSSV